jgi:hypothetical protein
MVSAASTTIAPDDGRLRHFAAIVEAEGLHGLAFQHLALCRRRAWLHLNRIDYAHLDRRMALGTVAHVLHRTRDRSVEGLMGLVPDRIDWSRRRVHEAKGGAGAKDAVSLQTAFYALLLMAVDRRGLGGRDRHPARATPSARADRRGAGRAAARHGGGPRRACARAYPADRWTEADLPGLLVPVPLRFRVMETLYINRDARIAREDATLVVTTDAGSGACRSRRSDRS